MKQKIWRFVRPVVRPLGGAIIFALFHLLRVIPIKKNKVVATAYDGGMYGDNQKAILEALHEMCPDVDVVWVKRAGHDYELPEWMRSVTSWTFRWFYEFATAGIWTSNSLITDYFCKRKGQLYIETWHGGLGIKKVFGDVPSNRPHLSKKRYERMSNAADVFISNSDHLSTIYRNTLYYKGPIWQCGYPMNDVLFTDNAQISKKVRTILNIPDSNKIMLYAPTHHDNLVKDNHIDESPFFHDFERLGQNLGERFGGEWTIMIRWHHGSKEMMRNVKIPNNVVNATDYPDMQELLMATDVMMSDYSSCIFDAAMRRIPCFIYASDYEDYKNYRGVYYEMEELPFPYAKNNDELEQNVKAFDMEDYLKKWDAFCVRMGLNETGHAAKDIAQKMADFMHGKEVTWPNDYLAPSTGSGIV